MPGQPFRRAFERRLREAAEQEGVDAVEGLSVEETYFMAMVADGVAFADIAHRFGVSRQWLYTWLNQGGRKAERWAALEEARAIASFSHADRAGEVLEEADEDSPSSVSLARERSGYHRWRAETGNRRAFGKQPEVEINVGLDLGALHKQVMSEPLESFAVTEEPLVLEGEVEDDG